MSKRGVTHRLATRAAAACLAISLGAWLAACGGGGGGAPASDSGGNGAGNGGSNGGSGGGSSPGAGLAALQAQLAACPTGSRFNEVASCMQGLYEGRATDDGSLCALRYDASGQVWYSTNRSSNRLTLSFSGSGATFHKTVQASSASGFSISLTVGIASGAEMSLHWQNPAEPGSANGLLVKSQTAAAPDCLITTPTQVAASSSTATGNQTSLSWDSPTTLNTLGTGGLRVASGASGNTGFDAGLADDGSAWVAFAQADGAGRLAVQVVQGQAGAAGQAARWAAPVVLDDAAPLLADHRPRLAVSSSGHAVVSWITERACTADAYELSPAGKLCRYMVATRRRAGASAWETPQVVGASPPSKVHDHRVRINAAGDVAITYVGMSAAGSSSTRSLLGLRAAADGAFRNIVLNGLRSSFDFGETLAEGIDTALDDSGRLVVAGRIQSLMGTGVVGMRSSISAVPERWAADTPANAEPWFNELATSDGFAAFTAQADPGTRQPLRPEQITFWSPVLQRWLAAEPSIDFAIWGNTRLVGTDTSGGEFLLYGGCRLSRWVAGAWSDTLITLPEHCGLDRSGGLYAFNRAGDYVGLHWGGHMGQWGYYRRSDNRLLKGAPGTATAVAADYPLGTASPLFAPADSQLLLNRGGLALAVTANTYTAMPTASQAGTDGGGALRLWAQFLR
ncbi:hypothetical protein [Aquabacterium sp. OR-4]|uniref:hypothetical protein n=1 Tax=Aquabacterium sp. OR-4 TaxID=2978127 RepID=UPI0021B2CC93|nr:hypothetical protein [Aquabacterium sp. OR-4]MDT7836059.1 hypothetical protein [Aquabacterium sp. OR-4]MDT7839085.1 hypothetical protein [Aquabacterium sp. OR-4]